MDLSSQNIKQLKTVAKNYNIKGYSTLKKDDLIKVINEKISKDNKEKNSKCNGLIHNNGKLNSCTIKTNDKYCVMHRNRYKYDVPDECTICFDAIDASETIPLACGHWFHKNCLKPTNIHICPLCRGCMDKSDIEYVFGGKHRSSNNFTNNDLVEYNDFLNNNEQNNQIHQNNQIQTVHVNQCNCDNCRRNRARAGDIDYDNINLSEREEEELIDTLSYIVHFRLQRTININTLTNLCVVIMMHNENKIALFRLHNIDICAKIRRATSLQRPIFNFINVNNYNDMRLIFSAIDNMRESFIN